MKSREQRLITKEHIAMHTNLCKFTLVITYCARKGPLQHMKLSWTQEILGCVFKFK